jgi:enterochelin esterase-like enzyme
MAYIDQEGRRLRGAHRGDGESEEVVMKRRPVEMIPASQVPRPFACPSLEETLRRIEAERDPAARKALVDALVARARTQGTPLVGPGTRPDVGCATFLYRGEAGEVGLAGDMTGWSAGKELLARVEGTDLFFLSREFPLDTRLDYKLLPDGNWMLDPLNPRAMTGGYGPNSELAMPRYVPPAEVERDPSVPRGTVEALGLESRRPGYARKASVYLPPGYAGGDRRFPVLYLHDGQDWLDYAKLDVILDNLIARNAIPPAIAVLVPPVDRRAEYGMTPDFEAFFVEEVVPAVDARYRTRPSPASRTVGGISAGGAAALSLALRHPEVFGRCIAQSTASWGKMEALRDLARSSPGLPSAVYLDVGRFEGEFAGSDMVRFSRELRDALSARGVEVRYQEVNEGHSWGNWRARMRDALPFVLGAPAPAR